MSKKELKLVGLDKALERVPQEKRATLAAQLEELFRDFDPENAPGEPVVRVAPGTRVCPRCCGPLVEFALLPHPNDDATHELMLECDDCDGTFSEPVERTPC